jgi:intergrase/recombinase
MRDWGCAPKWLARSELGTVIRWRTGPVTRRRGCTTCAATVRTRLSELGVPSDVAERVIGHEPQGLLRVYDRYSYLEETRQALECWNARLRAIVEPPPDNVVPLRVGASP